MLQTIRPTPAKRGERIHAQEAGALGEAGAAFVEGLWSGEGGHLEGLCLVHLSSVENYRVALVPATHCDLTSSTWLMI